jgi:hypothetical protein
VPHLVSPIQVFQADQVEVGVATRRKVAKQEVLHFNQPQPQVDMEILAEAVQTLVVAAAAVLARPAAPTQGEPDENGLPAQVPITVAAAVAVMAQAALVVVVVLVAPQAHQIPAAADQITVVVVQVVLG